MHAILHGSKQGTSSRGDRVPESVAAKYTGTEEGASESKDKAQDGGKWGEKHHKASKDICEFLTRYSCLSA